MYTFSSKGSPSSVSSMMDKEWQVAIPLKNGESWDIFVAFFTGSRICLFSTGTTPHISSSSSVSVPV